MPPSPGSPWTPRALARRWLTGGAPIRDYVPVAVGPDGIVDRARLTWPGGELDVSDRQWTLAYAPVVVGIALGGVDVGAAPTLTFAGIGGECARAILRRLHDLPGGITLFELGDTAITCLDPLRRRVLLDRLHAACVRRDRHFGGMTPARYRQYAAQFCYPRRVVLVCTPGGATFPIDLHGGVGDGVAFGIRSSNAAVAELKGGGTLALCEVAAEHQPAIYALGKMGGERPEGETREVGAGILAPAFIAGWRLVRVTHDEEVGVQRVFCGVVEHRQGELPEALHHQHLLAWLAAGPGAYRAVG